MDFAVVTGDRAIFDPQFGVATVTAQPGVISGSGRGRIKSSPICVMGDESTVMVMGAVYVTPVFSAPGTGILTIASLATDQKSTKDKSSGKAILLVGTKFQARFQVVSPAVNGSGAPDAVLQYSGTGRFLTSNSLVKAE